MGLDGFVAEGGPAFGNVNRPEYCTMNLNGSVTIIDDSGYILWESNAIVQYLGMKYDPELLYGNDMDIDASADSCGEVTN